MSTKLEDERELAWDAWTAANEAAKRHGRPLDARELAASFDTWWLDLHPPGAPIADIAPSWWHGCWLQAGHYLFDRRGRHADGSPLEALCLDGGYAPRRHRGTGLLVRVGLAPGDDRRQLEYKSDELPQGQFAHTIEKIAGEEYTILSWWDRTQGDARANCNSCFIVAGDHAAEAMLAAFPRHFPKQAERLRAAGVELVEAR